MPEQLPQIAILRTRYPDPREAIFSHQLQQEFSIFAVGLLLPYPPSLGTTKFTQVDGADIVMKSIMMPAQT